MDIDLMKRLQDRVNVIPIIAKADTLTRGEVNRLKARVRSDIQTNDIKVSLTTWNIFLKGISPLVRNNAILCSI